ncbi:MAG: DUF1858 domain-containing protein [Candidatus Pacearchaeota archaeon]|jgi:hybrid cluster-associated redox disulfide protein
MKKTEKPEKKSKQISKSMSFSEILEKNPELAKTLLDRGMHCAGCPMAMSETLEEGALAHGYDPDEIEKDINKEFQLQQAKGNSLSLQMGTSENNRSKPRGIKSIWSNNKLKKSKKKK